MQIAIQFKSRNQIVVMYNALHNLMIKNTNVKTTTKAGTGNQ